MPSLAIGMAIPAFTDRPITSGVPANAMLDPDGNPILDGDGNYILLDT